MKGLFILFSLLSTSMAFSHELKVRCNNILPDQIRIENGSIVTDFFVLSERLGYFDEQRTQYGLIQSVELLNAQGDLVESLNVVGQFYPGTECGPSKIVADNNFSDEPGEKGTVKITIEIENTCDAKNLSSYTLEREGKAPVVKAFTECSYVRK
ncbi:hypothetical protein M899_0530 [Bacteriovorax sp. BSW11_IV]|uniref:hypothetical protein n=1 Tax=Bacteriovorax sp. BSW11_IV TaxID=1353529 RepID=UPI00038A261E|nr:hypothetical protein [Bacteriovorax sp. BSW11_IV]EQC44984.1 hypothetical protein M899_0530 [Bacteriovorax sp. BSW11_IV]